MHKVIVDSLATAPGPDGVTYSMIAAACKWSVQLLLTVLRAILGGDQLPSSWIESNVVFLPKGQ
eukprot:6467297-Amphidinium_carterae.1